LIVALAAIMSPQLLLANFVRNNVVEAFRTSSQAMALTLVPGDCILCHKRAAAPARWSAVVYRPPHRPAEQYVSRVAGLPGETIEIRDGQVHVDGVAHPPPSGIGPYLSEIGGFMRGGPGTHGKPITLGRDEYYLLGDNSPLAVDSRFFPVAYAGHQRGALPRDKIVGHATYRYWPPARWRGL
jgi:signal peptidase I